MKRNIIILFFSSLLLMTVTSQASTWYVISKADPNLPNGSLEFTKVMAKVEVNSDEKTQILFQDENQVWFVTQRADGQVTVLEADSKSGGAQVAQSAKTPFSFIDFKHRLSVICQDLK